MDSFVKNAADKEQVKSAKQKELLGREAELNDLRVVLNTVHGRRVFWRLLGKFGLNQSVYHPSALIHYKSGQQDAAHTLLAEICEADEEQYFQMMREARQSKELSK
jgi:hypothetical protein